MTVMLVSVSSAGTANYSAEPVPPNAAVDVDIEISNSANLTGWRTSATNSKQLELIARGKNLLIFQLFIDDKDVSSQIAWQRLPDQPQVLAGFVGHHPDFPSEIRREYFRGAKRNQVRHTVRFSATDGQGVANAFAEISVPPNLRMHAPGDGSLGDYFYGYNRYLALSREAGGEYVAVEEQQEASEAALVARHTAIVIRPDSIGTDTFSVDPETGVTQTIHDLTNPSPRSMSLSAVELRGRTIAEPKYRSLLYAEMSKPLQAVARAIEWILEKISTRVNSTGGAVILFALLLRALFLPVGLWSIRQQRHFASIQRKMKPRIDEINETLTGAEKSEQTLQAYKDFGISPFSGLKGSLGLLIQLPILIALFAVTTESALFRDAAFLWFSDLSLPDRTVSLPFSIPWLGSYFNILPMVLGLICVVSALVQSNTGDAHSSNSPRSGLILALVFVIFFYPCSAALVLYWSVVNTSQIFEGLYVSSSARRH